MDYSDYYSLNSELGLYQVNDSFISLSIKDKYEVLSHMNARNEVLIRKKYVAPLKNISTSDVVLCKNSNRKFDKSNVCLRVTNNLLSDLKKMAGQLNVPVNDLMTYVLEYGFASYRVIKEI